MKLRLTKAARADLANIRYYTRKEHSPAQTKKYISLLRTGFKTLQDHPEIGYSINHLLEGHRCFQIKYHRVFYCLSDTHIIVKAILHEAQSPQRHLSQRPTD